MFAGETDGQIINNGTDGETGGDLPSENEVCPDCKTTREEFFKTGLVGCEYCYTFFREDVERIVEKIQAGTYYDTEKNLTPQEKSEYYRRRKVLNSQFAQAVRERDHSAAADIREELKRVNKILSRGKNSND